MTKPTKPPRGGKTISGGKPENIEVGEGGVVKMKLTKEGRALTVAQRLQRGRQIRRIKPKLQRAAKRSLAQSPSQSRLWMRSQRAARNILKKRFSPVKNVPYAKLSTTQKIFVDRALEKRQKLIRKVAKRLLPKVRAASFKRLQSYRMGTGRSRLRENVAFEEQFNQRPLPQVIESMIINMGDHPMADSLMTLLDLSADNDSPAVKSLKEKASSIGVPFVEILQVYADALLEYKHTGSKLSGEQYAFNAVNVYVADRKGPNLNEKFEQLDENLAGILLGNHMMFGKTSVISKGFGGGRVPTIGGRPDAYSTKDSKDERRRSLAIHAHASELHAQKVTAAGDDPSKFRYKPNQSFGSKAKHSSRSEQQYATAVDDVHRKIVAANPKEYSVSPHHAIGAYFQKNAKHAQLEPAVRAYDKHYQAASAFGESVTFKAHDDEGKGGHHLMWRGRKIGNLKRTSEGVKGRRGSEDHFTLHKVNGRPVLNSRGEVLATTKKRWIEILTPHFKKQDARQAMRQGNQTEESETDSMIAHVAQTIHTVGAKNIPGVVKELGKAKAKETIEKIRKIAKRKRDFDV